MSYNKRQQYNRVLVQVLSDYIEKYPDIRFSQALDNIGLVQGRLLKQFPAQGQDLMIWDNEYNLEPDKLLERVSSLSDAKNVIGILYGKKEKK